MTNRLRDATSPYLLQHADNPVAWFEWGDEAFAAAQESDRPVLVSVGYSACHWCHVMAHESFEDPATAALMNDLFVNVKVDREERPDVDALTMDATVTMTGQGGWPTTVFLTPDGRPFYAGTYFPPEPRHGLPGFQELLRGVAAAWVERRDDLEAQAVRLVGELGQSARIEPSTEDLDRHLLDAAEDGIARVFEPAFGGFGGAPKFPPASTIEFLLRRPSARAAEMVTRTLDGMTAGGMYDVVGGGFHRYSVDARWLVPHFEKMLYDNALLASAYLHAWVATGEDRYRAVAEGTVEYMLRELLLPDGGIASAQDADTDGVEGTTYTWTPAELQALDIDPAVLEAFEHGRSIIRGTLTANERRRLLTARAERPQPFRDEKVITSWNGLALAAIAEAGRRLARPDWVNAATGIAAFCAETLTASDGKLIRSWRDGRTSGTAFLDDYANLAHGLLELHLATGDATSLHEAHRLASDAVVLFADEINGGFFLAPVGHDPYLRTRTKDIHDDPSPSGNSMLASVLIRLGRLWGDTALEQRGVDAIRLVVPTFSQAPRAVSWALCALDLHLAPPRELALIAHPQSELARVALAPFAPNTVTAFGPNEDIPLLVGKTAIDGAPTAYLCERFVCRAPVTDPAALG